MWSNKPFGHAWILVCKQECVGASLRDANLEEIQGCFGIVNGGGCCERTHRKTVHTLSVSYVTALKQTTVRIMLRSKDSNAAPPKALNGDCSVVPVFESLRLLKES